MSRSTGHHGQRLSENSHGPFPFRCWEESLLEQGLLQEPITRLDADDVFQFGNHGQLKALFAADVPVTVYGVNAHLQVCVVAGHTPLLLSRATLSRLGLRIDFSKNTVSSQICS